MINILYTIILFNILLIFFKLFKKYNIDNIQALTANYLSGALYCYFYILINEYINLLKIAS